MPEAEFCRYDERANLAALEGLHPRLRVTFAFLAALRILPAYRRFHAKTGRGDPNKLERIAERLWSDLTGSDMTDREVQSAARAAEKLIPSEDDGDWDEETQPYAEDAAAALAYALRARLKGDPQEAACASRRVYEASDHFVMSKIEKATTDKWDELEVLSSPVVQGELGRQRRDLQELAELPGGKVPKSRLQELRARSEGESKSFFAPQA